jgi:predicted SAM-dependent methyltransferase
MYSMPFRPGAQVVELGGGDTPQFRPNVDVRPMPTVDLVADLNQPIPLEGNQFDGVFSMYAIEHVSWRSVRTLVAESFRLLKPGGSVVFVTANLQEQARILVEKERWEDPDIGMVFGDQNYGENAHACGFSPESALRMFREAGFQAVLVLPHPNCGTDMIIEAQKADIPTVAVHPETWTPAERKQAFDRDYFDGGHGVVGGYTGDGFRDFPVNWTVFAEVRKRTPTSVLELGCARGYVLKRLEDAGIRVRGLEVSEHCWHTRAVDPITVWDVTQTPWPVKDQEFDLAFSLALLERIPEQHVAAVAGELARTCRRGLHGVVFTPDHQQDRTIATARPAAWWQARLPSGHEVVDRSALEHFPIQPPSGDGKVKVQVGSYTVMFHHGWWNLDIHPLEEFARHNGYLFRSHDARKGLPFDAGIVDLLFASHFLEHVSFQEGRRFLVECHRVMKPGAVLRLIVPDTALLVERFRDGRLGEYDALSRGCAHAVSPSEKLWELLLANHAATYDWKALETTLHAVGFDTVRRMSFRESGSPQMLWETLDMFPTLSLYVEAVKT